MFTKKGSIGEYKEKIIELYVEDIIDDAKSEHFNAYIPFNYYNLKQTVKQVNSNGIVHMVEQYTLETNDRLNFKNGDVIRLYGNKEYNVVSVETMLPKKYESLVAMSPNLRDRYLSKIIKLNAL